MPLMRRFAKPRRGIILLVVITMLALFATVGLVFVLYAESEAQSSRIFREAQEFRFSDGPDAEDIFNSGLSNLIYDAPDDTGYHNALRGHSILRSMYGWNYDYKTTVAPLLGETKGLNNTIPYNGYGPIMADTDGDGTPDTYILNYSYRPGDPNIIDPERIETRPPVGSASAPGTPGTYVGKNLGYTYPDINNAYLAALHPNGTLLVQSYHRPEIAGSLDPSNPNWTNAIGRKLLMRPRPADNVWAGTMEFPMPSDATGDVKNLIGAPGGNDSIWIDPDLPVRTWKGKLYKPLLAFMILDLDSRMNVNAMGNILGQPTGAGLPGGHTSNQGWGPWEANLAYAMTANAGNSTAEMQQLLAGTPLASGPTLNGRLGSSRKSRAYTGLATVSSGDPAREYSQVDYDGSDVTTGNSAGPFLKMLLPGDATGPASGYVPFPLFPERFQNGGGTPTTERDGHPSLFNPALVSNLDLTSTGIENREFDPQELLYLNKQWAYPNDVSSQSVLATLSPTNLGATGIPVATNNPRWMVTPLGHDVDRPNLEVMVPDASFYGFALVVDPTTKLPTLKAYPTANPATTATTPATWPLVPTVGFTPTGDTDIDTTSRPTYNAWRNIRAAMGGVDLNQKLADYRTDPLAPYGKKADGSFNIDTATHTAALLDRQRFAKEIFERLVIATGADSSAAAGSNEHYGLRWLAQLAVNIVDYVDTDEYNTVFNWNGAEPLYGTELSRLVINEVYGQVNNDPTDPFTGGKATKPYHVNFWVELHNPTFANPALASTNGDLSDTAFDPTMKGSARLFDPTLIDTGTGTVTPAYKVIVADGATVNFGTMASLDNLGGSVGPASRKCETLTYEVAPGFTPVLDANNQFVVKPANGGYSTPVQTNNGFFVLGADSAMADVVVGKSSLRLAYGAPGGANQPHNGLRYMEADLTTKPADLTGRDHTVVLQKLACPHIAGGVNNPYVTVDMFEKVKPNDAVTNDDGGMHAPAAVDTRISTGRIEPYYGRVLATAGDPLQNPRDQDPQPMPNAGEAKHTMYRHNSTSATATNTDESASGTLRYPFSWPTHMDRQLINPTELMHVSAFPPSMFTQAFTPGSMANHTIEAALKDESSRLYRSLELMRCKSRVFGSPAGGKIPGRMNVNTMWSQEGWNAAFDHDPNPAGRHNFDLNHVNTAWANFTTVRTSPLDPVPATGRAPFTGFGNAVKGIAAGPTSLNADGIGGTMLRGTAAGGLANAGGGAHPYQQMELMRKGYNSITTRSHCFAVWCTIGYFEVRGYNQGRPVLGKEIYDDSVGDLRNQFFAVVDRANAGLDPIASGTDPDGAFGFQRKQGPSPFFLSLQQNVAANALVTMQVPLSPTPPSGTALNMLYEGRTIPVDVGSRLVIDYGVQPATLGTDPTGDVNSRMEVVSVTRVDASAGTIEFTVTKAHATGTMVSNLIMGNPGPQPGFSYRAAPYDAIVPVSYRLR